MSGRLRFALAALMSGVIDLAPAQARSAFRDASACSAYAPEAARRSGLSANVVLRVMMAESAGNPRAVSPNGAIGCMQIMPRTWSYLSNRYALGANSFDPRMNMIGGAMYLAELAARYGFPGAYSAYNAGPGRYERYAAGRARLPAETIAYTARIGRSGEAPAVAVAASPRWQEATLFVVRRAPSVDRFLGPTNVSRAAPVAVNALFPLTSNDTPSPREASER